jgi:Tol biopolymer transport system component
VRVTRNGSWDDSPAWDAGGRAIYFRSNRGGDWNVWRLELK